MRRPASATDVSLRHAESILATLREPFLVLDANLRVCGGNKAFYETFQVDPLHTNGYLLAELGNGQWNSAILLQLLGQMLQSDHNLDDFELEHDFEGIGLRAIRLNARRIRARQHDPELILLSMEDITDRRRAAWELRESEARYRRLFYQAADGMLLLDAETRKVMDANAPLCQLLGRTAEDLRGKEMDQIGLFCEPEEWQEAFLELQRTGYLRREHLLLMNRDGEQVEVELVGNAYAEGSRLVAQCSVRSRSFPPDIRQTAQQALAVADESRRKDEFIAMLGHELRNPLAPLCSAVHLLRLEARPGIETPLQRQAREIIERQATNLVRLVGELQDVSRAICGRIRLEWQTVDLNRIIAHAVETVAPHMRAHRHRFIIHPAPGPLWTEVDPNRMEEVFINLLGNAAKYTPDGGQIMVSSEHPAGSDSLEVRVRDTGVGIEKHLLPRIFDVFIQAEGTLARSEGGLGLGLCLVHRIVGLHGGAVEVASPPDGAAPGTGGTEFLVRIPVSRRPQR